tara:strand:- start:5896 stop:6702 length:807 start_codon:yes stop_codon:yes gene_type:complete
MNEFVIYQDHNSISDQLGISIEESFSSALKTVCISLDINPIDLLQSLRTSYNVFINFVENKECYGGEVTDNQITLNFPSPNNPDFNRDRFDRLIVHETTHVVQSYLLHWQPAYGLPKWFSEGMAVALAGQALVFTKEAWGFYKNELEAHLGAHFNELLFMDGHDYNLLGGPSHTPTEFQDKNSEFGYSFWGTAVAALISDNNQLDPRYAKEDGPFFKLHETLRLKTIIELFTQQSYLDFNLCLQQCLEFEDPLDNLIQNLDTMLPSRG